MRTLILCAVALLGASSLRADDAGLASGLVRNAWYWQARARSDKAEEAWKQVLDAAPDEPEALAATGVFHARAGRLQQARESLARLAKLAPTHPDLPVLRRAIETGARTPFLLAEARKLVHEGHAKEGAAKYRALFGAAGPPGDLALEYYQTLGGVPGGWEEARDGLRKLVKRAPLESHFKLSLARLLTYRDATRREGIELLASLARDPAVGKDATAGWRQALLWLAPTPADLPLFRAWEKAHPGDSEIPAHVAAGKKTSAAQEGFAALDRGDLAGAEKLFRASKEPDARRGLAVLQERRTGHAKKAGFAALERGNLRAAEELFSSVDDDDARLGLALVAQRQALAAQRAEDLDGARTLLLRARTLAPHKRELWEKPLQDVTFWSRLRDADRLREQGKPAQAEALLREARASAPARDRWHADLALGALSLAAGNRREAEQRYREVLSAVPDQADALRGLEGLLVQEGRFAEATPLNDRLARAAPDKAVQPGVLRAELLRSAAAGRRMAHDAPGARALLEEAQKADPRNLWVLHDLANVLLEAGALADARRAVEELLGRAPALPEARVTQARLLVAERDGAGALAVLESLKPPPADPGVVALKRSLEVQVQIPALLEAAAQGRRGEAIAGLAALQAQVEREPELAAQVAVAFSKLGEAERAVELMKTAMARSPAATRGARLELASSLLDAGDDAAVGQVLTGLDRDPTLLPAERSSLNELRVAHAVRLADRDRGQGDTAGAQAVLGPLLRDFPHDARLLSAQARVLEQGEPERARALYLEVLAAAPDDVDAARGAVDTSLAVGDGAKAGALADDLVARRPLDPRAFLVAARVAAQDGDDAAAADHLERALALADPPPTLLRAAGAGPLETGSSAVPLEAGENRLASLRESSADAALRAQAERELGALRARHLPGFAGGGEVRIREGERGLSALTELRQTFILQLPLGLDARAALHATAIELDAGAPASTALSRYGTGGPGAFTGRSAQGAELLATLESRHFEAFVGATPLGFLILAPVGGVRARATLGAASFAAGASRRSVVESVLSYAGVRDPSTGKSWGGVVHDSGRVDLGLDLGLVRAYAFGEAGRLVGYNVADNLRGAGGGGLSVRLYGGPLGEVRIGPSVTAMGYQRNLRFFTFGHGGYFSPQRFVHGALGLSVRHEGPVRLELSAEPGYDAYQEANSPAFPLAAAGTPQSGAQRYPGRSQGGLSFAGHAQLGIHISDALESGLTFGILRATEFQELSAGVVLRFHGAGL